jgi:hypothetical protein
MLRNIFNELNVPINTDTGQPSTHSTRTRIFEPIMQSVRDLHKPDDG